MITLPLLGDLLNTARPPDADPSLLADGAFAWWLQAIGVAGVETAPDTTPAAGRSPRPDGLAATGIPADATPVAAAFTDSDPSLPAVGRRQPTSPVSAMLTLAASVPLFPVTPAPGGGPAEKEMAPSSETPATGSIRQPDGMPPARPAPQALWPRPEALSFLPDEPEPAAQRPALPAPTAAENPFRKHRHNDLLPGAAPPTTPTRLIPAVTPQIVHGEDRVPDSSPPPDAALLAPGAAREAAPAPAWKASLGLPARPDSPPPPATPPPAAGLVEEGMAAREGTVFTASLPPERPAVPAVAVAAHSARGLSLEATTDSLPPIWPWQRPLVPMPDEPVAAGPFVTRRPSPPSALFPSAVSALSAPPEAPSAPAGETAVSSEAISIPCPAGPARPVAEGGALPLADAAPAAPDMPGPARPEGLPGAERGPLSPAPTSDDSEPRPASAPVTSTPRALPSPPVVAATRPLVAGAPDLPPSATPEPAGLPPDLSGDRPATTYAVAPQEASIPAEPLPPNPVIPSLLPGETSEARPTQPRSLPAVPSPSAPPPPRKAPVPLHDATLRPPVGTGRGAVQPPAGPSTSLSEAEGNRSLPVASSLPPVVVAPAAGVNAAAAPRGSGSPTTLAAVSFPGRLAAEPVPAPPTPHAFPPVPQTLRTVSALLTDGRYHGSQPSPTRPTVPVRLTVDAPVALPGPSPAASATAASAAPVPSADRPAVSLDPQRPVARPLPEDQAASPAPASSLAAPKDQAPQAAAAALPVGAVEVFSLTPPAVDGPEADVAPGPPPLGAPASPARASSAMQLSGRVSPALVVAFGLPSSPPAPAPGGVTASGPGVSARPDAAGGRTQPAGSFGTPPTAFSARADGAQPAATARHAPAPRAALDVAEPALPDTNLTTARRPLGVAGPRPGDAPGLVPGSPFGEAAAPAASAALPPPAAPEAPAPVTTASAAAPEPSVRELQVTVPDQHGDPLVVTVRGDHDQPVAAHVVASNAAVAQTVRHTESQVRAALHSEGVQVSSFDVSARHQGGERPAPQAVVVPLPLSSQRLPRSSPAPFAVRHRTRAETRVDIYA